MATLHVYLDESGNLSFNPKGSRFYTFTAAWTYNPSPVADALSRLRFKLIKDGHFRDGVVDDLSAFHACDDPTPRRMAFVNQITEHKDWNCAAIVIEKNRVNPVLYEPETFYPKFLTMVLNFVLRGRVRLSTNQVLIYTDTLPMSSRKQVEAVNRAIKASCQKELQDKTFRILHHTGDSNYWIQVADYCSWSIHRKWEHGDPTFYNLIRSRLAAQELAPLSKSIGAAYY